MSKRQADTSKKLTDRASSIFEVQEGYEKGASEARGMDRDEAVNCSEDTVVKEESQARPYLENAQDSETGEYIGKVTTETKAWEVFEGES